MSSSNENFYTRTLELLGENNFKKVQDFRIAIFGIGGVGGTALEALVRSGINNITIIDHDIIKPSNLNRQILFTNIDINKSKVEVAKKRLMNINPNLKINTYPLFFDEKTIHEIPFEDFDYVIDAIDSLKSKILLIKYLISHNIKFISSLGMGNRLDPSKLIITTLDKTHDDPLAKKLRTELKKSNVNLKSVKVVMSNELPLKRNKIVTSMMMVPSSAGLLLAYEAIKECILIKENSYGIKKD